MEENLIRRYFNGDLTAAEQKAVELRQKEDLDFAFLMDSYQSTRNGIRLAQKDILKERLKQLESDKKSSGRFLRIAIAASIAIIIGVGGMILWNQSQVSPENLYAEYYEPYPNLYAPITRDAGLLTSLEQAFVDYELGEYKKALEGFNQELSLNNDSDILFYKAITLVQLNQEDEALNVLKSIEINQTSYQPQVLWYLSLFQIKSDQFTAAKTTLRKLESLDSGYKTETAKQLLKKLN